MIGEIEIGGADACLWSWHQAGKKHLFALSGHRVCVSILIRVDETFFPAPVGAVFFAKGFCLVQDVGLALFNQFWVRIETKAEGLVEGNGW